MTLGRIQNLNRQTTAAEREAFGSAVCTTPTGSTQHEVLRWGDEVEILARGDRRTQIRAKGGLEGWVAMERRYSGQARGRLAGPFRRHEGRRP